MRKTIICFGDSNTYGYDPENFGRLNENERWPQVLAHNLGEDHHVIEEGLCGRTTAFNDPLNEGLNGLKRLVLKATATGCLRNGTSSILIIAPAPIEKEYRNVIFNGEMSDGCSEKSYALASLYASLAHELGCHFLDAYKFARVHPNDYMHIDKQGHQALAFAISNAISAYNI